MKTKLNYPTHTIASAPENSKSALEQLRKAFGVVPNIAGVIANSPKLVNALVGVFQQVHSSSFTELEIQIVLLTDAVVNACTYAVAFHTALALQQGIGREELDAVREHRTPKDKRFAALSSLARTLIEKRGHASEEELDSFIAAGFTKEQVFEVIAIVAASTITNYAGTVGNPPLDAAFQQYAWRG
jgi:AhpD family alkylhydroperoxidase